MIDMPNQTGKNQHSKAAKMQRAEELNKELRREVEFNAEFLRDSLNEPHSNDSKRTFVAARVTSIIDTMLTLAIHKELTPERIRLVREEFVRSLDVEEYRQPNNTLSYRPVPKGWAKAKT